MLKQRWNQEQLRAGEDEQSLNKRVLLLSWSRSGTVGRVDRAPEVVCCNTVVLEMVVRPPVVQRKQTTAAAASGFAVHRAGAAAEEPTGSCLPTTSPREG